ncbi:MAG: uroporphyrinogen-III C-methyltransferase [Gammaproteobacteria bacterium]|nr:uroporphyrinogen-III C-methyltransferase [Gammaproteobacteria bacterium]
MTNPIPAKKALSKKVLVKFFLWFVLVLIILGFSGLCLYQFLQNHKNDDQMHLFSAFSNQINEQVQQQQALIKTNQTALVYLLNIANQHRDYWSLAEIESLLQMADLTLNVQHNISTTITLLKIANNKMREMNDVRLVGARHLLVSNIVKLQSLQMSQVTPLYMQIQSINEQVEALPFITDKNATTISQEQTVTEAKKQHPWIQALKNSWTNIKQFLVVQKNEYPAKLILSKQEKATLKLNLHLYLTQAQSALLQRHRTIYQNSLKNAVQMIQQYFLQNDDQVNKVMQSLNALKQINITPKLPQINRTLWAVESMLHAYQSNNDTIKIDTKGNKAL